MIVEEQIVIAAPVAVALDRIGRELDIGGFDSALSADFTDSHRSLVRAGAVGVTKKVAVTALPPRVTGHGIVIAIRWQAVGLTGDLFPTLDANLTLQPAEHEHTLLDLVGSYLPPFGRVGAVLDQLVLHQVAHATLRRFLTQLATTATSMARVPTSETQSRPRADRHAWEPGT